MSARSNDPRVDFRARPTLEELCAQQGKSPVDDISVFAGAWPNDEPVEDFLAALRDWRGHGKSENDRACRAKGLTLKHCAIKKGSQRRRKRLLYTLTETR